MSFSGHGSEANLGGIRAASSCSTPSEGKNLDNVSYMRKAYLSGCFFFKCHFIVDRLSVTFLSFFPNRIPNCRYYCLIYYLVVIVDKL